jgi:benzoate 4-monooxygenase
MTLVNYVVSPYVLPWVLVALPILYFVLPWLSNSNLRDIPAPFPAQFTRLWLLWQARRGKRYLAVDAAHKKLGVLVRIQPNHISVADDAAVQAIYGHGNGFLKA